MKNKYTRYRAFSCISYAMPDSLSNLFTLSTHYSYINHDKCDCESHYHYLFYFKNALTLSSLLNKFPQDCNSFAEPINDFKAAYEYLTHKNNTDKYQYSDDCIITDCSEWWLGDKADVNDAKAHADVVSMLDDINDGLSYRELAYRYGRDLVKNYYTYYTYAKQMLTQECDLTIVPDEELPF